MAEVGSGEIGSAEVNNGLIPVEKAGLIQELDGTSL